MEHKMVTIPFDLETAKKIHWELNMIRLEQY